MNRIDVHRISYGIREVCDGDGPRQRIERPSVAVVPGSLILTTTENEQGGRQTEVAVACIGTTRWGHQVTVTHGGDRTPRTTSTVKKLCAASPAERLRAALEAVDGNYDARSHLRHVTTDEQRFALDLLEHEQQDERRAARRRAAWEGRNAEADPPAAAEEAPAEDDPAHGAGSDEPDMVRVYNHLVRDAIALLATARAIGAGLEPTPQLRTGIKLAIRGRAERRARVAAKLQEADAELQMAIAAEW